MGETFGKKIPLDDQSYLKVTVHVDAERHGPKLPSDHIQRAADELERNMKRRKLPPYLEKWCNDNPSPGSYAVEIMFDMIGKIVDGKMEVNDTLTFNKPEIMPTSVPPGREYVDVGARVFQISFVVDKESEK